MQEAMAVDGGPRAGNLQAWRMRGIVSALQTDNGYRMLTGRRMKSVIAGTRTSEQSSSIDIFSELASVVETWTRRVC